MKQIKVDYHFHPNLALYMPVFRRILSGQKAKAIWKSFKKNDLSVVVITEHAYKHPKKSFEILEANKPQDATTLILPGIEVLTKEGTDMIVFAKDKNDIYCHQKLLTPWELTTAELIEFIKNHPKLRGIVTHPYTPGATGILNNNGLELTKIAIKEMKLLEVHNCAMITLRKLFELTKLNKILKRKYARVVNTENAPRELIQEDTVITGGSDAHHVYEIGDYMEINMEYINNTDYLFDAITKRSGKIVAKQKSMITLIPNALTVSKEFFMKKLRLYTIDKHI